MRARVSRWVRIGVVAGLCDRQARIALFSLRCMKDGMRMLDRHFESMMISSSIIHDDTSSVIDWSNRYQSPVHASGETET